MRINFGLAALALMISLALWVLVVNDQNPERVDIPDFTVPVEVSKTPPGLVVMNSLDPVRFRFALPKTGGTACGFPASGLPWICLGWVRASNRSR